MIRDGSRLSVESFNVQCYGFGVLQQIQIHRSLGGYACRKYDDIEQLRMAPHEIHNHDQTRIRNEIAPLGEDGREETRSPVESLPKGTTAPPPTKISRTHKPDGVALEDWQRTLRREFGERQRFILKNVGGHPLFSEFALTNLNRIVSGLGQLLSGFIGMHR